MRLAVALAAVLFAGPNLTHAQTTERYSVCVPGDGEWIKKVCFGESYTTPRYGHSVLGNTPEWTTLTVFNGPAAVLAADGHRGANDVVAGVGHIFEDIAPRLADVDADGRLDIIVVHSAFDKGARLVAYAVTPEPRLLAATDFIGQANRWLAPAGIADFDGDGRIEIAYVDRPHLARELVFVRLEGDQLIEVARASGFSNHRIGDRAIAGGVRDCAGRTDVVLATGAWTRAVGVALNGRNIEVTDLGPITGPADLQTYMVCPG